MQRMRLATIAAALALSACHAATEESGPRASAGAVPAAARVAEAPVPSAPPPPPGVATRPLVPGGYLASRYGITPAEASRRLALEPLVSALSQNLHEHPSPGFSAIWIEHEPKYAVVIALKPPADEAAVLARADPALRPHLVFRTADRTAAEIERDSDRLLAALRPLRAGWSGGYDVSRGRFVFTFGSAAVVAEAQRLIPSDLSDDVELEIGSVPVLLER
jgi:hypothetical protein